MRVLKGLDYVARFSGAAALLLGLILWTGRLYAYVNLHMLVGFAVVLSLWALSALVLIRARRAARGVLGIIWGGATIALGVNQTQILPGDLHWIVQVVHLIVGLGAVLLATMMARALKVAL